MREELSVLAQRFIQNRDMIKSTFAWDSTYIYPVCAAVFVDQRKMAERQSLESCKELLKQNTGIFSTFRSTSKLVTIAMLAVSENPQQKLERTLQAYDALKKQFFVSDYLPLAAMMLTDMVEPENYEQIAGKTRRVYNLMKEKHPFLTSSEDSVFAIMLACSPKSEEQLAEEVESCYQILKSHFFNNNAVQSLSQVLALMDGSASVKCDKTIQLFQRLSELGCKYGTNYELGTLGVLAMLPVNQEVLCQEICEVDAYLASQKGYGVFGVGRKQRLMHAGMIVTSAYSQKNQVINSAAVQGAVSIIIAEQAALCCAIAASSVAASSASS